MPWLDPWIAAILTPLAVWIFLSGLDDLLLDGSFLLTRLRARRRTGAAVPGPKPAKLPQRKIAVIIPCWSEAGVIERMLDHNLAAVEYENYDVWLGVYPNDPATLDKVAACERNHPRVRHVVCPHPGPTTKADCLNWIYEGVKRHEEASGERYAALQQQDAEDLIPPAALEYVNREIDRYEMIQFPVRPLVSSLGRVTQATYADEFAEFHAKDLVLRNRRGGFIPSAGVGTAYRRDVLERLAERNEGRLFDPLSLTEDYFIGWQVSRMGCRQRFVAPPPGPVAAGPEARSALARRATCAYFPRGFRQAVRQRARWVTGIVLQSWERFGWGAGSGQAYWLWRDRKGLLSHPASMLANLVFVYGLARWAEASITGAPWRLGELVSASPLLLVLLGANLGLLLWRQAVRAAFSVKAYGWLHGLTTPLRTPWANLINFCALARAVGIFFSARLRGDPLHWNKTAHDYPAEAALSAHRRGLGEILVAAGRLQPDRLDEALASLEPGERLGDYLVRRRLLSEAQVHKAIATEHGLAFRRLDRYQVRPDAGAELPEQTARHLGVIPFEKDPAGRIWFAGAEPPSRALRRTLARYSERPQGFVLITPANLNRLLDERRPTPLTEPMYQAAGD